jgi:two-component system NtrC family sensor kinase
LSGQEEKRIDVSTEIDHANGDVAIMLKDNGPGIESQHLPRLFDPFFTTKEVGKGTGLGLSICYRLIKDHGGDISVSSVLGKYTLFTVALPLHESVNVGHPTEARELQLAES